MQSTTGRTDAYASATEWLTSDEAALYLKVERRTLLQWVRQGKVRAYILSGMAHNATFGDSKPQTWMLC